MRKNSAFEYLTHIQFKFLMAANAQNLKYLVTGQYAGRCYGVQRQPKDLEILVDHDEYNIRRLVHALEQVECSVGQGDLLRLSKPKTEIKFQGLMLLSEIPPLSSAELFNEITHQNVNSMMVPVISLNNLIQSIKHARDDEGRALLKRQTDQEDLKTLLTVSNWMKILGEPH